MAAKQVTKAEWDALPWKWKYQVVRSRSLSNVTDELGQIKGRMGPVFKFKVTSIFYDVSTDRYTAVYEYRSK